MQAAGEFREWGKSGSTDMGKGNKKEGAGIEAEDGNAYGEVDRGRTQEGRGISGQSQEGEGR